MLQTLQVTDYACNKLNLLSQNNLEDAKLPVRVENRRCLRVSVKLIAVLVDLSAHVDSRGN